MLCVEDNIGNHFQKFIIKITDDRHIFRVKYFMKNEVKI